MNLAGVKFEDIIRYLKAVGYYIRSLQTLPMDHHSWNYRGTSLYFFGQYKKATLAYDKAIHISPKDTDAWYGESKLFIPDETVYQYSRNL